ncbi:MerR family transcriptional regulator [Phytoactinopolyspora endophytica]|uniref:MerR family transcriptional regulator n=1 Tax=Phytoactinopolyspora endophytica TaxID=1642495 RepID=UPI00101BB66C|nr:MerR family transcriptional regulator [Phytoactinopolyspora endophytica]
MTVGELSRKTGVSVKTLRQYTDWGLIYTIGRSTANYRLFDNDALWCVQWIGMLRGLGLTVAEIRELAETFPERNGGPIGPRLAERLRVSRARIHTRMAELQRALARIDEFEAVHRSELEGESSSWADDPRVRCGVSSSAGLAGEA